jgi:hypothetical protein
MKTGNVKQVATFEELLGFCHAHGALYNPSKTSIKIAALEELFTAAQQSLEAVKVAITEYNNAVNVRQEAFNRLPVFSTRIVNALAATDASKATLEEAYAHVRKFRWQNPPAPAAAEGKEAASKSRKSNHRDFNTQLDSFESLVKVVSAEPSYQPNEPDLTLTALTAHAEMLRSTITKVIDLRVTVSNLRATRDKILYDRHSIHDTAIAVKRYIKGVFGYRSVAYNQVKGLKFIAKKIR